MRGVVVFPEEMSGAVERADDKKGQIPRLARHQAGGNGEAHVNFTQQLGHNHVAALGRAVFPVVRHDHVRLPARERRKLSFERQRVGERRAQARRIPAGDQHAVDFFWRIGHRYVEHDDPPAGLAEQRPQRRQGAEAGIGQAKAIGAEVALPEIKDAVLALVGAGDHRGPGLRGKGVQHRFQRRPGAAAQQAGQRGQFALRSPGLNEIKGGPIEADDDDSTGAGCRC